MRAIFLLTLLGSLSAVGYAQNAKSLDLKNMPHRLGPWEGKDDPPMPPGILAATGADGVINRTYRDSNAKAIELKSHLAAYSDWKMGIFQNPMTVYKACGWKLISQTYETIPADYGKTLRVSMSEWEKNRNNIVVLYWYQWKDQVVFDRTGLDQMRSKLSDEDKTKPLVKVQLQILKSDAKGHEEDIKKLVGKLAQWIEKPVDEKK
jgi:hypothetical protein